MKLQLLVAVATVGAAQAFCPSYCSGHGECVENDICECFPGFGEADCSVRTCPSGLSWVVGTSSELSSLPTPNGPMGKHPYTECSSRGVCDRATGECDCFAGYTGKACRRSACPNECSGHGLCVADGDVRSVLDGAAYYGGDDDFLLAPQKQYWNAKMSHQCICDQQYTGYDCSTRICPLGLDPSTSCDDVASASDVQAVTLLFGADTSVLDGDSDGFLDDADSDGVHDHVEAYLPENIEQFFVLDFVSQFNAKYSTPPISYWDTAATVQQALISLPNFAVGDVQVFKMFPNDPNDDTRCSEGYFNEYQSTLCTADADCQSMFPSLSATTTFCDTDIGVCIETDTDACAYVDSRTEFRDENCALDFEVDGLYQKDGSTDFFWGHRLTSFERNCQAGKFSPDDTKYALPCTANADCVPCAGWTTVTNGVCNDANVCSSMVSEGLNETGSITRIVMAYNTTADGAHPKTMGCGVATFLFKFTDSSTPGVQNDLQCTIDNANAVESGASPMYRSSGLQSCQVTHVGVPAFTDGKIQDAAAAAESTIDNNLIFCVNAGADSVETTMVAAADCAGNALDMDAINAQVALDNGNVASVEGALDPLAPNFFVSGTDEVYTAESIENKLTAYYDTAMPCSNKGSCDYATGVCQCASGFTGSACDVAITYV